MNRPFEIVIILGTRPEAIKLAPLTAALRKYTDLRVLCVSTQQHSSLLRENLLALDFHFDLEMTEPDRTNLHTLTASVALGLGSLAEGKDLVVVQGDTLSAFAGALHGFLMNVPVAHVEAGLRTSRLDSPHPEEGLRRAISSLTSLHLAPTENARRNLEVEGVNPSSIVVTGNTSIDAVRTQIHKHVKETHGLGDSRRPYCVITVHRRENWGDPIRQIATAVAKLAQEFPGVDFVCPLHPNPAVRSAFSALPTILNLHVIDPLPHDQFVPLLANSLVILTDSGGIQEEATVFQVPVVILRQETERPEVLASGLGILAGTDSGLIFKCVSELINQRLKGVFASGIDESFGDGYASQRAATSIRSFLLGQKLPSDMYKLTDRCLGS